MALLPVTRKQRQIVKPGRESGSRVGRNVGAGLGAIVGGIAGIPGGPVGIAAGAGKGALTGASAGSLAGDMVQPGRAGSVETQQSKALPTMEIAQQSQQMFEGLRSLEELGPELQQQYATPLTEGYIASLVELKNRGVS